MNNNLDLKTCFIQTLDKDLVSRHSVVYKTAYIKLNFRPELADVEYCVKILKLISLRPALNPSLIGFMIVGQWKILFRSSDQHSLAELICADRDEPISDL
jgi:hypothetical protein